MHEFTTNRQYWFAILWNAWLYFQVRVVMESAADEKQKARIACMELTKRFMQEKAAYEAALSAQSDELVNQVI